MDVASLGHALREHWIVALLTFLLVSAVTSLAVLLPEERFEATARVSVQPGEPNVSTQLLTYLIPSIEARVRSQAHAEAVDAALPLNLRGADRVVTTDVPPGSGVMNITVESVDADAASAAANAHAQALSAENIGTTPIRIVVIDEASEAESTADPLTILVSGLGLGLVLAPLAALARARSDRRRDSAGPGPLPARGKGRSPVDVSGRP